MIDLAELVELDINPLLVDDRGTLALDARIRVAPATISGAERLAIRPYPKELEECAPVPRPEIWLRPIRPEDEPQHAEFLARIDPEMCTRFFHLVRVFSHSQLARFTQIDYDREIAFIATRHDGPKAETLGVVRAISDPDRTSADFAILVRSDLKGKGLARFS